MKNFCASKTKIILFVSIIFFVLLNPNIFGQQQIPESKYTIDNCVNVFNPAKVESTKVGYQYWFADKNFVDGRTLKLSVVAPHSATHPPHVHAEDEFFFVIEGKAEFYLAGKTRTAEGLATFYCPSNVEHGIKNVGDTQLKYLVVKKYQEK